ncbi:MAG: pyrroline-5-carboxylate reductase [Microscillaceae bacterium]|nr:pyrroline-5-carboxylate reductase [Microscillaceae bacterium]MDW8461643.1 pyrroline-5-carboxylate reductase [Cytophagales bacterium]
MKIHIIGGGNLGTSMARGLNAAQQSYQISVSRRNISHIQHLETLGIRLTADNKQFLPEADIVILAVKPKQAEAVCAEVRSVLRKDCIFISVVTGLSIKQLENYLRIPDLCIIRAMPNTAIALRESMTCLASHTAHERQKQVALTLFEQLGKAIFIEESLMDASTVLGACGIAFALRFIRAAMQGGIEIGFDSKTAALIATQTVKGAAQLLLQDTQHPEIEIDKVTTPQGCTIVGLNEMEHRGFSSSLIKGIVTSYKKIGNMQKEK